jgi:hypothetical protein
LPRDSIEAAASPGNDRKETRICVYKKTSV